MKQGGKGLSVIEEAVRHAENLVRMGEERGHPQGLEEGLSRSLEESLRFMQQAVLDVLAARGVAVDDELRGRIEAGRSIDLLSFWLRRAAVVGAARDILEPDDG